MKRTNIALAYITAIVAGTGAISGWMAFWLWASDSLVVRLLGACGSPILIALIVCVVLDFRDRPSPPQQPRDKP